MQIGTTVRVLALMKLFQFHQANQWTRRKMLLKMKMEELLGVLEGLPSLLFPIIALCMLRNVWYLFLGLITSILLE